jgi:hypothetical protein
VVDTAERGESKKTIQTEDIQEHHDEPVGNIGAPAFVDKVCHDAYRLVLIRLTQLLRENGVLPIPS